MWRCAILLALACTAARATTVERLSLADLTARADQVLVGTCQAVEATVVDGQPHVRYRFRVDQSLKGTAGQEAELVLPGGRLDGVAVRIPGMPTFAEQDEAVLFLVGSRPGPVWPVGLGQGAFRILRAGAAKPARVVQQLDGLSLRAPGAAKPAVAGQAGSVGTMQLSDLLAQVRGLLQRSEGDGAGAAR
jgi:hypothetical protein